MHLTLPTFALFALPVAALAQAGTPQDPPPQDPRALQEAVRVLTERVDELEDQVMKTADRVGDRSLLQAYTADSLDFGGHVTSVFSAIRGEDDTEVGHLVSLLELYLHAKVADRWSLFATPGFYVFNGGLLDDPTTPTTAGDPLYTEDSAGEAHIFLSRCFGQVDFDDRLQVAGGILGSPHGTTNREYFIPARIIGGGTLHTRYFLTNQLYPQQLVGLKASGKLPVGEGAGRVEYDAYYGVEDVGPADPIGGLRLAYVCACGLSVAGNYGRGTREAFTPDLLTGTAFNVPFLQAPFRFRYNLERDYDFAGVDVEFRNAWVQSRTEAYYSGEEDVADQLAVSQEINAFVHPLWTLSYRFDYYDAGADVPSVPAGFPTLPVADLGHATEHVFGICFSPHSAVRLRLDLHHTELPNTDDAVQTANLSWSLSF